MENKTISIIVPAYNSEDYLAECINSLTAQTYKELDIVIVNDGSSDSTAQIADEHARKDPRVRVYHQENRGVSAARNLGISHALGDWMTFVDADDYIDRDHIEKLFGMTQTAMCDCVISGYREVYPDGTTRSVKLSAWVLDKNKAVEKMLIPGLYQGFLCNKLFRTDIIRKEEMSLNEAIFYCEDLLFCAQYFNSCNTICCISADSYNYRQHEKSAVLHKEYSERWLARRRTSLDAFELALSYCNSSCAKRLCKARWYTECERIFRQIVTDAGYNEAAVKLLKKVREGCIHILVSRLSVKYKIKYICLAAFPGYFARYLTAREMRHF